MKLPSPLIPRRTLSLSAALLLLACGGGLDEPSSTSTESSGLGEADERGERPDADEGEGDAPDDRARGERCRARARQIAGEVAEACVADGGGRRQCAQMAHHAFRRAIHRCMSAGRDDRPEGDRPAPDACAERCGHHGRELDRQCIAEGGEPELCHAEAREAVRRCVVEHCGDDRPEGDRPAPPRDEREPPPPPADDCVAACGARGREIDRRCNEEGGEPEACRVEAVASVEACVVDRCDADAPPPPRACPEETLIACRDDGSAAGRACAEAGGTREECHAAAVEAGRACVAEACPAR